MITGLLYVGAAVFVTIGDLVLAQWARSSSGVLLPVGLLFNVIGIVFYAQTLRFESVGIATAIFLGANIVAVALGGYFLLNQHFSIRQLMGFILIIVAIGIMEIGG